MPQPSVVWAQRSSASDAARNFLNVFMECPDISEKDSSLEITPTSVKLNGRSTRSQEYAVDLELYAEIVPEQSTRHFSGRGVDLVLRKKETKDEYWPRLLKTTVKLPWLRTDFNKWVDEDEQDEQEPDAGAEAPGAPGGLDLSQLAAMQGLDPSALQGLDPSALSKGGDDEGDDEEDEGDEAEMPGLEDPEKKEEGEKDGKKIQEVS